ncbi:MAG: hypothetical protein UIL36_08120, partial [Turicibacter sp.]|nr:hypothetical protein [Turicibacter sp.]
IHSLIATFAFRIPLTYLISQTEDVTLYELGFAAPLSTIVSIIICFGYLAWENKKQNIQQSEKLSTSSSLS